MCIKTFLRFSIVSGGGSKQYQVMKKINHKGNFTTICCPKLRNKNKKKSIESTKENNL